MKKILSIIPLLAASASVYAATASTATSYYHRRPAPVTCPLQGCSAVAAKVHPGPRVPPVIDPIQAAILSLDRSAVDFGSLVVGSSPTVQSILVTNSGQGPATFKSLALLSGQPNFNPTTNCTGILEPGASCSVDVSFSPSARGSAAGKVQLLTNGQGLDIDLAGTGLQAAGVVTAVTSADFGAGLTGTATTLQFTYVNSGDAPATGAYMTSSSPDLKVQQLNRPNSCGTQAVPKIIPIGGACVSTVTYLRSTVGDFSGAVSLVSSAEGSPLSLSVSGKSLAPMLQFSPATLSFGTVQAGTYSTKSVTVTNVSSEAVTGFSLVPYMTYGQTWANTTTCGSTIAAGTSCQITVQFAPGATGAYASYDLYATTQIGQQMFSATGSGMSPIQPDSKDVVMTGTVGEMPTPLTLTVRNTTQDTTVTGIRIFDEYGYGYQGTTCDSLAPGESCTLKVDYYHMVPATLTDAYYFILRADGIYGDRIRVSIGPK